MFQYVLLISIVIVAGGELIDKTSFLVQIFSKRRYEEGAKQLVLGNVKESLIHFHESLLVYPYIDTIKTVLSIGNGFHRGGNYKDAIDQYDCVLRADVNNVEAYFLRGISLMHLGDVHGSALMYNNVLSREPNHVKARLNMAFLHHRYGRVEDSIEQYNIGLHYLNESKIETALLIDGSQVNVAYKRYESLQLKLHTNLAVAYLQLGLFKQSKSLLETSLSSLLRKLQDVCNVGSFGYDGRDLSSPSTSSSSQSRLLQRLQMQWLLAASSRISTLSPSDACSSGRTKMMFSLVHLSHLQRAICDYHGSELLNHYLLTVTMSSVTGGGGGAVFEGGLMPFDSLLEELPLSTRLVIAESTSRSVVAARINRDLNATATPHLSVDSNSTNPRPLRLGFISFDFNNHPTAHLAEGIYRFIRGHTSFQPVRLFTYSYGKNDNSFYRRSIQQLSHRFVDIAELSHDAAAQVIAADEIDILLEMQVHTLGKRLEIAAARPAPIQVNYLVYPGTSGASFLDSIVVDRVVVPPEHAQYYSEGLVMVPLTYQISFYGSLLSDAPYKPSHELVGEGAAAAVSSLKLLREQNGLPTGVDDIIFCNFNKVDKIDQGSLHVWMGILQRLPRSYLWLLDSANTAFSDEAKEQSGLVKENLFAVASLYGVGRHRIVFASRVEKWRHVARHAAADIFLDTLAYGAHSTATDALYGAVPVLTVPGGSFPSRVGASLYGSLCGDSEQGDKWVCALLMPRSVKEMQDTAIKLAQSRERLETLRRSLARMQLEQVGLFHPSQGVRDFLWGMQALYEVKTHSPQQWKRANVISNL